MSADHRTRSSRAGRWLVKLGLHRPEMRAWAMYDWADSAVWTTVIAAVFPIYFYSVAGADLAQGQATARFALATTTGLLIVAIPRAGPGCDRRLRRRAKVDARGVPGAGRLFASCSGGTVCSLCPVLVVRPPGRRI